MANNKVVLKLYVTGQTPRSERVVSQLRKLCKDDLGGQCQTIIIDVLEQPHLAEQDKILATPTLIKQYPPPIRRIIGDLSNTERVLTELGLTPVAGSHANTEED